MNVIALVVMYLAPIYPGGLMGQVQVPIKYYNTVQECMQDAVKLPPEFTLEHDYWCKEVTLEDGYAVWENE